MWEVQGFVGEFLIFFLYYQDFARVDLGPRQALDRLWYNGMNKRS